MSEQNTKKAWRRKIVCRCREPLPGTSGWNRSYQRNEKILRDVYLTDRTKIFYEDAYEKNTNKIFSEDELQDLMVTLKYDADGVKKAMAGFFRTLFH